MRGFYDLVVLAKVTLPISLRTVSFTQNTEQGLLHGSTDDQEDACIFYYVYVVLAFGICLRGSDDYLDDPLGLCTRIY